VMYRVPADPSAFDAHYFGKHVPLAKSIPGLRRYEVSQGPVGTPAGPSNYHLVVILHFDDLAAIEAGFASPQGQAAVADVQTFATGGVDIYTFDNRDA
jgi:uncharacterized protein (TIGR02118 family)